MVIRKLFVSALTALILLGISCAGTNSIDSFYNAHKDDNQVLAVRVPEVMLDLIAGISPEMQGVIGSTRDVRFMRFEGLSQPRIQTLYNQMSTMTANSFIEVYRKNDEIKRNVISIREKRNTVREILVYSNDQLNATFLYFNGEFDPERVRAMAQNEQLTDFSDGLIQQFGWGGTTE